VPPGGAQSPKRSISRSPMSMRSFEGSVLSPKASLSPKKSPMTPRSPRTFESLLSPSRPGSVASMLQCTSIPTLAPPSRLARDLALELISGQLLVERARQVVLAERSLHLVVVIQRCWRRWLQRRASGKLLAASRELKAHLEAMRCRLRFAEFRESQEAFIGAQQVLGAAHSLKRCVPSGGVQQEAQQARSAVPPVDLSKTSKPRSQVARRGAQPSGSGPRNASNFRSSTPRGAPSIGSSTPRTSLADMTQEVRNAVVPPTHSQHRSRGGITSPERGKPRLPSRTGKKLLRSDGASARSPRSPREAPGRPAHSLPSEPASTPPPPSSDLQHASSTPVIASPPEQLKQFLLQAQLRAQAMYETSLDLTFQGDAMDGDLAQWPNDSTPPTSLGSAAVGSAILGSATSYWSEVQGLASSASVSSQHHLDPSYDQPLAHGSTSCDQQLAHGSTSFASFPPREQRPPEHQDAYSAPCVGAGPIISAPSAGRSGRAPIGADRPRSPRVSLSPSPKVGGRRDGPRKPAVPAISSGAGPGGPFQDSTSSRRTVQKDRTQSHSPPPCRPARSAASAGVSGRVTSASQLRSQDGRSGSIGILSSRVAVELAEMDAVSTGVAKASLGKRVSLRSISGSLSMPKPGFGPRGSFPCSEAKHVRSPRATIGNSHRDTAEFLVQDCHKPLYSARGRSTPRL